MVTDNITTTRFGRVRTGYWLKPIPTNQFDWAAWLDDDPEKGTGYGVTEPEAIADLIEWLELFEEEAAA